MNRSTFFLNFRFKKGHISFFLLQLIQLLRHLTKAIICESVTISPVCICIPFSSTSTQLSHIKTPIHTW